VRPDASHGVGAAASCRECLHFEDDPQRLEQLWPTILILSSTYGAARGDSGVCRLRDLFQLPEPGCGEFERRDERNAHVALGVTAR
jgi:hypothetical protein